MTASTNLARSSTPASGPTAFLACDNAALAAPAAQPAYPTRTQGSGVAVAADSANRSAVLDRHEGR
jgi:hypothetical protein